MCDPSIESHCFVVTGEFTDDDAYSHFMKYLDYAQIQLEKTHEICKESTRKAANSYIFPWNEISKEEIETKGFYPHKLKFELDKNNILKLLIGHTLYSDANVVLRELTQNAIDAGRYMRVQQKSGSNYIPKVHIIWDSYSRVLTIKDNGTGMNENIILNFLFKVGSSRYQDAEFIKENPGFHSISRFGIGLLTCFMISDNIKITTSYYKEKGDTAHLIKIRNVEGEYIMRNDASRENILEHKHGSTFELQVRNGVEFTNIEEAICKWIIVPNCEVTLIIDGVQSKVGYENEEAVLRSFLNKIGVSDDNPNYQIQTFTEGCTTVSFLMKKNEMYGYWSFVPFSNFASEYMCPIGICIEGIMVSDNTPGYKSKRYVAFANCKGHDSPTTNVARDRLEDSEKTKKVLKSIYKQYFKVVNRQISHLTECKYTLPWSITEGAYTLDMLCNMRNDMNVLSDIDLFNICLESEKIVMVDNGKACTLSSLNDLPEMIWTIESQAYSSAVSLIQEIRDCSKTPLGITKELITDSSTNIDLVYADNYFSHYSGELFLKKYQIKEIRVDTEGRRIDFCWQKHLKNWSSITSNTHIRYNRSFLRLYIQKEEAEVKIQNLENDSIIRSRIGTFILKENPLAKFLNSLIKQKNENAQNAVEVISIYIGKILLINKRYREADFDKYFNSDENFMSKDIWSVVHKDELKKVLEQVNPICIDFNKYYRNPFSWD